MWISSKIVSTFGITIESNVLIDDVDVNQYDAWLSLRI